GDVPARHRVSFAETAAFDPERQRQEPDVEREQPAVDVGVAVVQVRLGPLPRPVLGLWVGAEPAEREPVAQCKRHRVADAGPALLARVDKQDSAEALACQAAEIRFYVAIE